MSQTDYNNLQLSNSITGAGPFTGLQGLSILKMILLYACGIFICLIIVFFVIGYISASSIASRITELEKKYK